MDSNTIMNEILAAWRNRPASPTVTKHEKAPMVETTGAEPASVVCFGLNLRFLPHRRHTCSRQGRVKQRDAPRDDRGSLKVASSRGFLPNNSPTYSNLALPDVPRRACRRLIVCPTGNYVGYNGLV